VHPSVAGKQAPVKNFVQNSIVSSRVKRIQCAGKTFQVSMSGQAYQAFHFP